MALHKTKPLLPKIMRVSRYFPSKVTHIFCKKVCFCLFAMSHKILQTLRRVKMIASGFLQYFGGYRIRKVREITRWHLKTCSSFSTEERKHVVLLTFIIDFRKPGRLLRKWFPSLSYDAVPIIDSVGRCLIISKSCFAMPDLKLLARGRTQLSSCLVEELQQDLTAVVPPARQSGPGNMDNLGM